MAVKPKNTVITTIFEGAQPERVRKAVRELDDKLVVTIGDDLSAALEGSHDAARRYVLGYRTLVGKLLEASVIVPTIEKLDARRPVYDPKGGGYGSSILSVLEDASTQAPFSPFADQYDLGDAVALELTSRARVLLGYKGLAARPKQSGGPKVDELATRRFLQRVRRELNQLDEQPLLRVKEAFGLSKTELASLFGVTRQAIDSWLRKGVPVERQEKLNTLVSLVELLERKLKPDRLPGVARTPADAYAGLTMLDMVREDRHRELLDSVRESFDWSTAA